MPACALLRGGVADIQMVVEVHRMIDPIYDDIMKNIIVRDPIEKEYHMKT